MAAKNPYQPLLVHERQKITHIAGSFGTSSNLLDMDFRENEAFLGDDMTLEGWDIKELFKEFEAEHIVKIIQKHGVERLGETEIEEWLVKREFKGRTTKTMGSEDLEIKNWERMWIDKLMAGKKIEIEDDQKIKVEAFAVAIRNATAIRDGGLLHPILKRWEAKACPIEIWGLPAVRAVVSYKWNKWAKKMLILEFVLYFFWLASFMLLPMIYNFEDLERSIWDWKYTANSHEIFSYILIFLSQTFMLPFTFIEVRTILADGLGWINIWNVIDAMTQFIQVSCTIVYLFDTGIASETFNIILACQVILLVVKIQFFARAFVAVESSMLDTLKAVLSNISWYLLLMVLTAYSFSCAFLVLYRNKLRECDDFEGIFHSFLTLFGLTLGEWEIAKYFTIDEEDASNNQCYFNYTCPDLTAIETEYDREGNSQCQRSTYFIILIFFCLFMVVMCVIFYNLLIAMMIDSHSRQMEIRKLWVHLSRAQIINELETALPRFITKKFTVPYIHVLRIVPERQASLDKLWNQIGMAETSISDTKEKFEIELENVEKDIMSKIEKISECIRLELGMKEAQYHEALKRKLAMVRLKTLTKNNSMRKRLK